MVYRHLWYVVSKPVASTTGVAIIKCVAVMRGMREGCSMKAQPFFEGRCWSSHTVSWTAT